VKKLEYPLHLSLPLSSPDTGKTKHYLHRFQIADNPMCPCNEGMQTSEHIIYVYNILKSQISSLIKHITARGGEAPPPMANW